MANLPPEEVAAEKLRLKKLQEEADLKTALDTLGLTSSSNATTTIDSFDPTTKEEFAEYSEALSKKIAQFKAKEEYVTFLDDLVRNLCAGCELFHLCRVTKLMIISF